MHILKQERTEPYKSFLLSCHFRNQDYLVIKSLHGGSFDTVGTKKEKNVQDIRNVNCHQHNFFYKRVSGDCGDSRIEPW